MSLTVWLPGTIYSSAGRSKAVCLLTRVAQLMISSWTDS